MKQTSILLGWLALLMLAGCGGSGAVVFAPTPLPPDTSPIVYVHPSGAFEISVPRAWSVQERNAAELATATFSAPGSSRVVLSVAVVELPAAPEGASGIRALLDAYQNSVRPDLLRYTEQSREAMSDGSWRMTGLRRVVGGGTELVNTFVEIDGTAVGVLDVVLPENEVLLGQVEAAVNTFRLGSGLSVAPLDTLSFATSGRLEAVNIHTWTTDAGVFFVTGEIANYGDVTRADIPVTVALQTADGRTVTEAADVVMGYGVGPGEFAPFSLRFGAGQPPLTARYTLTLGGAGWDANAAPTLYSEDVLTWTDASTPREDGGLIVTGTVTNTSEEVFVYLPRAIVTVFNDGGQVIGAAFTDLEDVELAPGEASPFTVVLPELGGEPSRYIVRVQGQP